MEMVALDNLLLHLEFFFQLEAHILMYGRQHLVQFKLYIHTP